MLRAFGNLSLNKFHSFIHSISLNYIHLAYNSHTVWLNKYFKFISLFY